MKVKFFEFEMIEGAVDYQRDWVRNLDKKVNSGTNVESLLSQKTQ